MSACARGVEERAFCMYACDVRPRKATSHLDRVEYGLKNLWLRRDDCGQEGGHALFGKPLDQRLQRQGGFARDVSPVRPIVLDVDEAWRNDGIRQLTGATGDVARRGVDHDGINQAVTKENQ